MTVAWLGTAGWSYFPDWVGPFYPPGTQPTDALARYVEAFPFVEVDATFYAAPAPATVARWAEVMPPRFRVAVKAPRGLVQDTGLRPPDVAFGHFVDVLLEPLHDRLARVVVQMPPSFQRDADAEDALDAFVHQWGRHVPLALELRDATWLDDAVVELLATTGVVWVCNELPAMPRVAVRTVPSTVYVRLLGPHGGIDGKDRLQRPQLEGRRWWTEQLAAWAEDGLEEAFVAVNNHYEGHAPATVRALGEELAARGLEVPIASGHPEGQLPLF